ncbi:unnamed protein product [Lathyrus sativus]|nr:unnamed protein product [Lathyrus sativus]
MIVSHMQNLRNWPPEMTLSLALEYPHDITPYDTKIFHSFLLPLYPVNIPLPSPQLDLRTLFHHLLLGAPPGSRRSASQTTKKHIIYIIQPYHTKRIGRAETTNSTY